MDDLDALGLDFDPEIEEVVSVQTLSTEEIAKRLSEIKSRLLDLGEALHQHTQEARDLHSERAALLIEYAKRNQ